MSNPPSSSTRIATADPDSFLAPVGSVSAPLSSEPQSQSDDIFEFEVQSPSDSKEAILDEEDDLATPLEPLSSQFIHDNYPIPPGILNIDPATFDTEAAIRKHGYNFNYSTEAPRRLALLVGIKGDALKGSHNDVDDTKALLMDSFKWREDEIMVLKDDDPESPLYPIRQTVVDHLFILVHDARDGDRLFIHFSGHGSQIEDEDGDETDGLDEVICCADGEIIVDDQLHDILVKPLPKGCRLTALFDCCASGTGLDLVRTPIGTPGASPNLPIRELQFNATFAGGALDLPHAFESNEDLGIDGIARVHPPNAGRKKYSEGDVVMWSACLDNADSHEVVTDDGRYKGAMSHAFSECLRYLPDQSYSDLLHAIEDRFRKWNVPQQPQLTSSKKLDRNASFCI